MSEQVSELLKRALALPAEARAALAGSLLESVEECVDAAAEAEREIDYGNVKPIPWAEARE
jgi:hypothetical protein